MLKLLELLESRKCPHDIKDKIFECGNAHCLYCIFDKIKDQIPQNFFCLCEKKISFNEAEEVFSQIQPKYNRSFRCECGAIFKAKSSLMCLNHQSCIRCRLQNKEKCIKCDRVYENFEKQIFDEFEDVAELKKCLYCRKNSKILLTCKNRCEICENCYKNLQKCICGDAIDQKIVIICVNCNKEIPNDNVFSFPCQHPAHKKCKKCKKQCSLCKNVVNRKIK